MNVEYWEIWNLINGSRTIIPSSEYVDFMIAQDESPWIYEVRRVEFGVWSELWENINIDDINLAGIHILKTMPAPN